MNTHEDFSRKEESKAGSDKTFGWLIAALFAIVGSVPLFCRGHVRWWALGLGLLFLLLALVAPSAVHILNQGWSSLGIVLGRIVHPIVIALLFYLVVTPIGLLMRLLGNDLLRLSPDPKADSYWIERQPPGPPGESMARQF